MSGKKSTVSYEFFWKTVKREGIMLTGDFNALIGGCQILPEEITEGIENLYDR